MGTTLQNGVYLPNEGERNCYAGLKTNWEILDQKVADVTALQQAVAGALHREIVESLPTTDIDPNTIYMILSGTSATENVYNEYMYVNNAWELIGTSATDLTNYYTKAEVDGKLLLKASASDLTSHTGDTTIHVTTADKNKWNNQTYVFRYSSTALVASSTNSNILLDNTDNLKVGDKVIDSDGVLFSITAIDSVNSTFTVGSALVDLALDGNVVHTSGDETVGGIKTFSNDLIVANTDTTANTPNLSLRNYNADRGTTETAVQTIMFSDKNAKALTLLESRRISNGNTATNILCYNTDKNNNTVSGGVAIFKSQTETNFSPNADNSVTCGRPLARWSKVYGIEYYYGNPSVEFSTKFVTTDTAQTISGNKTFSSNVNIYNSDPTATTPNLYLKSSKIEISSQGNTTGDQNLTYLDKNNTTYAYVKGAIQSNGSAVKIRAIAKDSSNNSVVNELQMLAYTNGNKAIFPSYSNEVDLGVSSYKWKSFNGVEPSSLSLPTDNLNDIIDISSYLSVLDGSNANTYVASANGWISITMSNCSGIQAYITGLWGHQIVRPTAGVVRFFMPVLKNKTVNILIFGGTIDNARFIPCQGNV